MLPILLVLSPIVAGDYPFAFRDVSEEAGILPHASGMRGHSAAWGDADGDGWLDVHVGTFFENGSKAGIFLRNRKGRFELDAQEVLRTRGCASGAVFADLDNDGDADFYLSNVSKTRRGPDTATPNRLFRNDGGGRFSDVSARSGASPDGFKGRSAAVLDFDGDGRLDILVGEDHSYGSEKRSRLFRNRGGLIFEDATRAAGLPETLSGLGVAAGDVNDDGWPDVFLAGRVASNVLFLNDGRGRFREAPGTRELFAWEFSTGDDAACGASFGDLDRDGRLDIVVGHHYKRPWVDPVPIRAYLNRGADPDTGVPRFEEVTKEAGLAPLSMKAPHVEVQDFDNDGWPDIYVSIVKFAGGKPFPVIYRNAGVRDGIPRFREDAFSVNDFPTPEDRSTRDTGDFFRKMLEERKIEYVAPGPSADFDNDGRLDLFLVSWWIERGSLLLRNETDSGNWLQVAVEGGEGTNRMGIGSKVLLYRAGKLGDAQALAGCREVAVGYGYASGQPPIAHFGLGDLDAVDLEVRLPHGKGTVVRRGVPANQRVTVGP